MSVSAENLDVHGQFAQIREETHQKSEQVKKDSEDELNRLRKASDGLAQRLEQIERREEAWRNLPWYKKLFTSKPTF